jgi:hypothetical protein
MVVGAQSHDSDAVFEQIENGLRLPSSKSSVDSELWERGYGALCHLKKARPTGTCLAFTSSYLAFREEGNQKSVPETTKYTNCLLLNLQQPPTPLVAIHKDHKKHPSSPSPSTIIYYPFNPRRQKCYFNTQSRTKPSKKLPTSFATTATTGANSVTTLPNRQGKLRRLLPHAQDHQNTRLPRTKDALPLNFC